MVLPTVGLSWVALVATLGASSGAVCDLSGVWHGHPQPGVIARGDIQVTQAQGSTTFTVCIGARCEDGVVDSAGGVKWTKLVGTIAANTPTNGSAAPACTRINWTADEGRFWCKDPWCEWVPPGPSPSPLPPPPPPIPAPPGAMNVLFIACDDLRAQFGRSFQTPEVLSPNIDAFFLDGGGAAMQHSYVQVAVCGPSRSSMLTGRRPDTTYVGTGGSAEPGTAGWCWCERTKCASASLFMTLPTYFRRHGYVTAGGGKLFHPDACSRFDFPHAVGDDPRAWTLPYYSEANNTQIQWGSIPGPHDPIYGGDMGRSFLESPLADEDETDGMIATDAVNRLANFSGDGIGKPGANRPFFLSVGFHKPHLPHVAPKKYFDLYPINVSLAPNRFVPTGFKEENFHADGTAELVSYNVNAGPTFKADHQGFATPVDEVFSREQRRGYFACVSFLDAQVGRVLGALTAHGYKENTVVLLWGDHGWHLGDTNSWGKMTNFESGTRNAMLWRVPNQRPESTGLNNRFVESIDIFPTLVELTGVPALPKCGGLDQPPTVECLQGESIASEFVGTAVPSPPKQHAFSQWPYPKWGNETGLREGYTVRSADGYRYTYYVPYDPTKMSGNWSAPMGTFDEELYDYNTDKWETTSFAANVMYAPVLTKLRAVLRAQYTEPPTTDN